MQDNQISKTEVNDQNVPAYEAPAFEVVDLTEAIGANMGSGFGGKAGNA